MNKQELNKLANTAKEDEIAAWEIKAHYLPIIEKLQIENWHKMNSETSFEDDCFRKINYAIRTFDEEKGDFDKRVMALLYQSLREYCGRRGDRRTVLVSIDKEMDNDHNDDTDTVLATFRDETVDVEAQAIEGVEKTELLQQFADNQMDKLIVEIILESNDLINQSEITRKLADRTGRTFNSARGVVRSFCARKQAELC